MGSLPEVEAIGSMGNVAALSGAAWLTAASEKEDRLVEAALEAGLVARGENRFLCTGNPNLSCLAGLGLGLGRRSSVVLGDLVLRRGTENPSSSA